MVHMLYVYICRVVMHMIHINGTHCVEYCIHGLYIYTSHMQYKYIRGQNGALICEYIYIRYVVCMIHICDACVYIWHMWCP